MAGGLVGFLENTRRKVMRLAISAANQFRALIPHIVITFVMVLAMFLLSFERAIVLSFAGFWILFTLPVIYLHFEYLAANRAMTIEIDFNNQKIAVSKNDALQRRVSFQEIEKTIIYKSGSLDKGGFPILTLEYYYFAKIVCKDGFSIVITCLMASDLDNVIRQMTWVPYERKKILFSSINYNNF